MTVNIKISKTKIHKRPILLTNEINNKNKKKKIKNFSESKTLDVYFKNIFLRITVITTFLSIKEVLKIINNFIKKYNKLY